MALETPDTQTAEITGLIARQDLRQVYLHFTNITAANTYDVGSDIVAASWEGDTDADLGSITWSGSIITFNMSDENFDGGVVFWVRDFT